MSGSKHFNKIAWVATALMLAITILFMNGAALGIETMAHTMGYETRLFDHTRVHSIDIVMSNWDELIANAVNEEYYTANLVIDGEAYKNVGIRGKGNTSLSNVASMNSERYSFKIEFDHYDSSLSYYGLDKLCLNNLIQDSTMMKDYLTYTMMEEFGVATPLCSFVYLTVNGEDWGLYLAVEGVEDAFLERNYGADHGELYKPDSLSFGGGRGNGKDFNMDDFFDFGDNMPEMQGGNMPGMQQGENMPEMQGGNMPNMSIDSMPSMPDGEKLDFSQIEMPDMSSFGGMGSSDVKLQYVDDELDSYSNIWESAKTKITESDKTRLVQSLKMLSNQENLESVVDIDEVIRYFVVHNYVCNGDSYTGSMIHNYYLYEKDGQMAMIPWDYNLAFGTFTGGQAQSTVNTPIDSPIEGGSAQDRPMWSWVLSDETYTTLYHQYFEEFLTEVDMIGIIDDAYTLIESYVEKDPTKFYTYEEFEAGVETLKQFCTLRSASISAQLENGETVETKSYADASGLKLSDMGSMTGGGMGDNMPDFPTERNQSENQDFVPGDFDLSQLPNGEMPSGEEKGEPESSDLPQLPNDGERPSGEGSNPMENSGFGEGGMPNQKGSFDGTSIPSREEMGAFGGDMTRGDFNPGGELSPSQSELSGWIWIAVSIIVLGVGLVIAKRYR